MVLSFAPRVGTTLGWNLRSLSALGLVLSFCSQGCNNPDGLEFANAFSVGMVLFFCTQGWNNPDGLEFANAFGVSVSEFRRSPRSRRVASEFRRFGFGVRRSRRFASEFRRSGPSAFRFRGSAF
jgi:hypothetical protein